MTSLDLIMLSPLIILAVGAVVNLLVIAFVRRQGLLLGLTLAELGLAFGSLFALAPSTPVFVTRLFVIDRYALVYMGLLLAATFVVALLAYASLSKQPGQYEELYLLLVVATLGAAVLTASRHVASLFLGLEILTVSLYVLIAYPRLLAESIEAGIKYLVLAAVSSGFLLFGLALVYADLGSMNLNTIFAAIEPGRGSTLLVTGLAFALVGVGFKLAVVPFHLWTPDIYQGSLTPVTAFIATVSKGAMFAVVLRYFPRSETLLVAIALLAVASMLGGNLLALLQTDVKRLLAYSSIAHLGYLLVTVLAGGALATTAGTYYLMVYMVTILGAFGVVTLVGSSSEMGAYRGLFWRRPWLGAVLTLMLLSLAGIPLTAGFIGKYYILAAGITAAEWGLVFVLIASSAIGLFYYLRLIVTMSLAPQPEAAPLRPIPVGGAVVLAVLSLIIVALGLYPAPFPFI